ncbi:ATP-binding protein [Clostridiaceae bacterium UIB06]|uniref:ATP-binding protein n=1 Tax=Clostridium thailandense TaxID=2794346 RepID=A0A949WQ97_9CLOT|nr:ATP-binding protein [Clostridium thailandense]MBV7272450.1 ATP-binding protein [Clostridium thailandense]MCH5136974.1 ATP-binding protein [Clostridiaceae bacterium UIB06]
MKELFVDAVIDNLDMVMDFVNSELETYDCSMKVQTQIDIAIEEIFVNISSYAYKPEVGPVTIRVAVDNEVIIEFEDKGTPYNPIEKIDPDITKSIEEREIGGLGIFMVKKIMDSVEYKNVDNKNILIIRKGIE